MVGQMRSLEAQYLPLLLVGRCRSLMLCPDTIAFRNMMSPCRNPRKARTEFKKLGLGEKEDILEFSRRVSSLGEIANECNHEG